MQDHIILGLSFIIAIGVLAQWVAMQMKLPSILFLLVFGCVAGPITGVIKPDLILGDLLFPIVSLSVAIILFEGGTDLKLNELKEIGKVVLNMITIGVLVTWVLISAAAYIFLQFNLSISILLGAMLVVTGPTVIGPLLRHMRPSGKVGNIVKWEGIMNDPIGVIIAVLVFESILSHSIQEAGIVVFGGIIKTLFMGIVISIGFSGLLIFLLKRYLIPDALHQVFTLMLVIVAFVMSNIVQPESGLLTVTLMGIILANQNIVSIKHIVEFKENLRTLIICTLFIILSARLKMSELTSIDLNSLIFVGVLILVVRPVSVWIATMKTDLRWQDKLFVAWMAPRGIVAAAMASIFAFELSHAGHPEAARLVPITFLVIIATVVVYGITATPLAHFLKLAKANPQGTIMVGAHRWARLMAKVLQDHGLRVVLMDSNGYNISKAKKEGLEAYHQNVLTEGVLNQINLEDVGRIFAMTPNDEANTLAAIRFQGTFGRANIYQLYPEHLEEGGAEQSSQQHLHGRFLFSQTIGYEELTRKLTSLNSFEKFSVSEGASLKDLIRQHNVIPLFLIRQEGSLGVFTDEGNLQPEEGDVLIALRN